MSLIFTALLGCALWAKSQTLLTIACCRIFTVVVYSISNAFASICGDAPDNRLVTIDFSYLPRTPVLCKYPQALSEWGLCCRSKLGLSTRNVAHNFSIMPNCSGRWDLNVDLTDSMIIGIMKSFRIVSDDARNVSARLLDNKSAPCGFTIPMSLNVDCVLCC